MLLCFSPFDLVFGHTVCGPLKQLTFTLLGSDKPQNLLNYVSNFSLLLQTACDLPEKSLEMLSGPSRCVVEGQLKNF